MPDALDRWFVTANGTVDNLVTPLIDRTAMMAAIAEQIEQMREGDFCFYGAWAMNPGAILREGEEQRLDQKLGQAVQRRASVRLVLFRGMPTMAEGPFVLAMGTFGWDIPDPFGISHMEAHRSLVIGLGGFGLEVIIDTHHPTLGSHHSKYAIFGKALGQGHFILTAFIGGMDLASGRDDSEHDHVIFRPFLYGWHDVHAKLEGPAAEVLWNDFVDRWNSNPTQASETKTVTQIIDRSQYAFTPTGTGPPGDAGLMTHRVEVLNTYACASAPLGFGSDETYYPLHANGLRTIEQAYLNAIGLAEHFIYIENLYFLHQPLAAALLARLEANPALQVILVINYLGAGGDSILYRLPELQTVSSLLSPPYADRVHLCDLRHPDGIYEPPLMLDDEGFSKSIFVHSKVMIVDDVYATIGSANADPRSMTHDTEINIGFVDTVSIEYTEGNITYSVSPAVRDLRVALWREHLQVDQDPDLIVQDLITIPTALRTWVDRITYGSRNAQDTSKAPSRVFNHSPRAQGVGALIQPFFWTIRHPTLSCAGTAP